MITINAQRNGTIRGVSMIAHKNSLNPYFLFGVELNEENQKELMEHFDFAKEHRNPKSNIPEYTVRTLLLWQDVNRKGNENVLSYPECGIMPDVQTFLMFVIVSMHIKYPDRNFIIDTCSEYMVRGLQLAVAKKLISPEQVQLTDEISGDFEEVVGTPEKLEFQG